ncbi:MAG: hypothetical protein ACYDA6_06885 [Solirubrobacteraceae bacterium]
MADSHKIPLQIRVDGAPEISETIFTRLCAYGVVLHTALPATHLQLVSTSEYVGYPDRSARASHLAVTRGTRANTELLPIDHPRGTLDVRGAPRKCLYDHLQRLQRFLNGLGHEAAIDVSDEAIEALDAAMLPRPEVPISKPRFHPWLPLALLGGRWLF